MSDTTWLDDKVRRDFDDAIEDVHRAFCYPDHELSGAWDRDMADAIRRNGYVLVKVVDSLDAAWAAAEATLPKGWHIRRLEYEYDQWVAVAGVPDPPGDRDYGYGAGMGDGGWGPDYGYGPTPAAALRALAAMMADGTADPTR